MRILTTQQARQLDADASERLQMPSLLLMENAARGVAEHARALGERWMVLCGPGNNGGDGMAAARHLGRAARVLVLQEPRAPDAALQLTILRNAGHPVVVGQLPDVADSEEWVWIDAMFGTGLTRSLEAEARQWVEAFNAGTGPKLAVDIPSGLHGDSGEVMGVACRADVTVTFEAPKQGLVAEIARSWVGRIEVVPLGLPEEG